MVWPSRIHGTMYNVPKKIGIFLGQQARNVWTDPTEAHIIV